jgi:hypothetical protein
MVRPYRQRLGLLIAVVVFGQVTKWWAWRHASVAMINAGVHYGGVSDSLTSAGAGVRSGR